MDSFVALAEAFPDAPAALVLHALRANSGDAEAAAEYMMSSIKCDVAAMDAALAAALAEEESAEAEAMQREREASTRSEDLLTLCTLFPTLEVEGVQAAYERHRCVFVDAYDALHRMSKLRVRSSVTWKCGPKRATMADRLRLSSECGIHQKAQQRAITPHSGNTSAVTDTASDSHGEAPAAAYPRSKELETPGPPTSAADLQSFYRNADEAIRAEGDEHLLRQRAYAVNSCRIRTIHLAQLAHHRGDGAVAKSLSMEGRALGAEYERLNRLAMLALELERLNTDAPTTLDLHGFHTQEVGEVLTRRVDLCRRKGIRHLVIVYGEGHHSRSGVARLREEVQRFLAIDPLMKSIVRVTSMKPGFMDVSVRAA